MIMSFKQKKIKIESRIKLNHNIYPSLSIILPNFGIFFTFSRARCFLSVVDITWDGSGWLKGNVGQTGFYRINYMQQQWEQLSNQLDTDHQVGLMKMTPDFVLIGLTNLTALFSYHLCSFNVFRMVRYTKCFCVYKSISLYYFCIYLWGFSAFFENCNLWLIVFIIIRIYSADNCKGAMLAK